MSTLPLIELTGDARARGRIHGEALVSPPCAST